MGFSFFDKRNWDAWPCITYCAANTWKNFKLDYAHSHDRLELLYVYYGEVTLSCYLDGEWKELSLYSNDYALIDVDVPHTLHTGSCISQVFALELKLIPETLSKLQYSLKHLIRCDASVNAFFSQDQKVVRLSDSGHLHSILRELQQTLKNPEQQENYLDLLIPLLFTAIGNDYRKQLYLYKSGIRHLRTASEYIVSNFHRDLNCQEIAALSGVSLNYLNKLFTEQFGMTVNTYINRLRIREAMQLIERTDIALTEIYRQIGYKTNQNFNKQFTKHVGCTPSSYRKQFKNTHFEKSFEKNNNFIYELPQ